MGGDAGVATMKSARRRSPSFAHSALALLLHATIGTDVAADRPVIVTDRGPIEGIWQDDGLSAFHGVPFAAPPVGALRWRPPRPHAPWTTVR